VLRELGISTSEYNAIMHDKLLTTEEKHLALLTLIETKTKDGRKAIDDTVQSQNALTIAWQDFTSKTGPDVLEMWRKLNEAATTGLGILTLTVTALEKIAALGPFGTSGNASAVSQMPNLSARGPHRRAGGPVSPGESYTVGEQGPETFTPNQGGSITPFGGGRGLVVHNHFEGIYAGDGPSLDILANKIALRLGYATGR
jgi:hypothetical protein